LVDYAEGKIEDGVEEAVKAKLAPALAEALASFSVDKSIDLPPPAAITLKVSTGFDLVSFCGASAGMTAPSICSGYASGAAFGRVSLATQIFPAAAGPLVPASARGAIKKAVGAPPTFSATSYGFGIGLNDDLFNQAFWAVWYGGGLDIYDLTAGVEAAPAGIKIHARAMLPPVVMPGRAGNTIEIGIGDLFIDATADAAALMAGDSAAQDEEIEPFEVHASMWMSLVIGATLDIDPSTNELIAIMDTTPVMAIELVDFNNARYAPLLGEVMQGFVKKTMTEMSGKTMERIPLPTFNEDGAVELLDAELGLRNGDMSHVGDYSVLTGSLGATPLAP
jgi:hypothetical protein